MRIQTGQVVRGDDFWDRPYLMEDIYEIIENSGHVLLVAPRRVGKTSLMRRVEDTASEAYVVVYIDVEGEETIEEFWKKVFEEMMAEKFISTLKNNAKNLYKTIKSISVTEIGLKGIKFGESASKDYQSAFSELLRSIDGDKKLIILMDEFAQAIDNIKKIEGDESAEKLLRIHRELRQNQTLSEKVIFVYAGSIGLESVVASINSSKHINDLVNINVPPLEEEDAIAFAMHLSQDSNLVISEETILHLLNKLEWYIPFYIQLIIQEVKRLYRRNPIVDNTVIDQAVEKVLSHRKDFVHWIERLKKLEAYSFARELLSVISEEMSIDSNEIFNLATKYTVSEDEAKEVIHILKNEGYINNNEDIRIYRFNSELLRIWWYRNVAN